MKKLFFVVCCVTTCVAAPPIRAQEPTLPSTTNPSPGQQNAAEVPAQAAAPSATPAIEPPELIPSPPLPPPGGTNLSPSAPGLPDLSQLDAAFKQSPLGKAAQEYKLHVEWRKLQNRTTNDAEVLAAKASAEAATTDLEKRERLRIYYDTYFRRMRTLAETAEMKTYLVAKQTEHIARLAQPRVRPSPGEQAPSMPVPERRTRKKRR